MFNWIKDNRIKKYRKKVEGYVESNYIPPAEPVPQPSSTSKIQEQSISGSKGSGDVKYSLKFPNNNDGQVMYSDRDTHVRYSDRGTPGDLFGNDTYSPDDIAAALNMYKGQKRKAMLNKAIEQSISKTFVEKMLSYMAIWSLKDSKVYKAAHIDRRLYSKMVSDRNYKPSKDTAIAIAFALKLDLRDAEDLLRRAGYSLSHSNKRDVIIEYFFSNKIWDLDDVNAVLNELDEKIIGN